MNNTKSPAADYAENLICKSLSLIDDLSTHHAALEALAAQADILAIEDYLYNFQFATTEAWDEENLSTCL